MRELLIASRHRYESIIKSRQASTQTGKTVFFSILILIVLKILLTIEIAVIQDVKAKQLHETLIHAQEALVIQILLDVLHQYKKVGSQIALHNFSVIDGMFLDCMYTSLSRITRRDLFIHSSVIYQ